MFVKQHCVSEGFQSVANWFSEDLPGNIFPSKLEIVTALTAEMSVCARGAVHVFTMHIAWIFTRTIKEL